MSGRDDTAMHGASVRTVSGIAQGGEFPYLMQGHGDMPDSHSNITPVNATASAGGGQSHRWNSGGTTSRHISGVIAGGRAYAAIPEAPGLETETALGSAESQGAGSGSFLVPDRSVDGYGMPSGGGIATRIHQ